MTLVARSFQGRRGGTARCVCALTMHDNRADQQQDSHPGLPCGLPRSRASALVPIRGFLPNVRGIDDRKGAVTQRKVRERTSACGVGLCKIRYS